MGVEAEWFKGVKLRVEYRYTDFGSFSQNVPLTSANCGGYFSCGTNTRIDMDAAFHTVRAGLGIDF